MNVLLHVQHLLGIGHDRRIAAITRALVASGAAITVIRGGFPVPGSDFGAAKVIQLPATRATDATFKTLVDENDRPIDEAWRERRSAATLEAFRTARPDRLIVESFPFARGAFRFELIPLMEAAREAGCPVLVSVRDILVAKGRPGWAEGVAATVERLVDRVMVHGDPDLVPFAATFPLADRIADKIAYTGVVAPPPPVDDGGSDGRDEVIVSMGGGGYALPLARVAIAARPLTTHARATWRILVGPMTGEAAFAELRDQAPVGVIVERARRDFPLLLARCRLSISLAGYNTTLDVLRAGCRAVLVPASEEGETEQAIRARLLAERGVVAVVDGSRLSPERLAAAVRAAPDPARLRLRDDGAREAARIIRETTRT